MALTNEQFDSIMNEYEQDRNYNRHIMEVRKKKVSEKIPRMDEISKEIANASVETAKKMLEGNSSAIRSLKDSIKLLSQERTNLLVEHGFPADYLKEIYTCPDCKDTGYINNQKCHCLKQKIIDTLYSQSSLKEILHKENFDNFSFDYYSSDFVDDVSGKSALENIEEIVDYCHLFIKSFNSEHRNLLIYGKTGVGKTYLSNCIAKELIESGHSVVYVSAIKLFDIFSDYNFNSKKYANVQDTVSHMLNCDLLIIDDLGTELTNTFTLAAFFNCLNERLNASKSTIISTNLSIEDLSDTYSERIFSRIIGNYTLLKIFGEDIRLKTNL